MYTKLARVGPLGFWTVVSKLVEIWLCDFIHIEQNKTRWIAPVHLLGPLSVYELEVAEDSGVGLLVYG